MLHRVVANEELVHFADIHPPTFGATCPSSPLTVYAESGLFSAAVNWTEPAATDNLVYAERGEFSAQVNWNEPVATDNIGATPSLASNYKPVKGLVGEPI